MVFDSPYEVRAVGRSQIGYAAADGADQMFDLLVRSQVFLGGWFVQKLFESHPDDIGPFEPKPRSGFGDFPIQIFRKADGQL